MPPEIGPIGNSQDSNWKVQPINWSEKVNLNERRVPNPPGKPSGNMSEDLFVKSDEGFWGEPSLGGDAPEPAKGGAPEHGSPVVEDHRASRAPDAHAANAPDAHAANAPETTPIEPVAPPVKSPAPGAEVVPETYPPAVKIVNTAQPTLSEMPSAELQAKRTALIKSGTGHSILELESVNQELARRGLFRNAFYGAPETTPPVTAETATRVPTEPRPPVPKTIAAPKPVVAPESAIAPKPPATSVGVAPDTPSVTSSNPYSSFLTPLGKVTTFGLGALGVVGGMFQIRHGVDELSNSNYFEGGMSSISGVCNTTAGGATFFSCIPFANTLATRAGGLGAIFDGSNLLVKGYQNNNEIQLLDGGVRTSLGATMLTGGPVGWCAGSGYAGWSAGRFIGERKVYGNETVDDLVTRALYNTFFAPSA